MGHWKSTPRPLQRGGGIISGEKERLGTNLTANSHKLLAQPETEIKPSLSLLPVPVLLVQCSHSVSGVNLTTLIIISLRSSSREPPGKLRKGCFSTKPPTYLSRVLAARQFDCLEATTTQRTNSTALQAAAANYKQRRCINVQQQPGEGGYTNFTSQAFRVRGRDWGRLVSPPDLLGLHTTDWSSFCNFRFSVVFVFFSFYICFCIVRFSVVFGFFAFSNVFVFLRSFCCFCDFLIFCCFCIFVFSYLHYLQGE